MQKVFIIILGILLISTIFFGLQYIFIKNELTKANANAARYQTNEKILNFTQLFIKKVLKAQGEVDFETRLQLETAVRDLDDAQVLAQWESFIKSASEIQAQEEVKKLLELLVDKIKV